MKLLFITHYTGRGGGESVQLNLMSELAPRGHKLHLVTPQLGKFNELAAALGVQSHVIPFRGASTMFIPWLYKRFPVVSALTTLLKDLQIDLVHSDYHALPFAVGAGQRAHIPVLWNAMGGWFAIKRWQHGFFRNEVTRSVAITDVVRRELLDGSWMPLDKMPIIIPGVNPDELKPGSVAGATVREKIGIAPDVPLVSLIGRFQHIKGQHIFLEMAQRILAKRPDVHFALVGDNVFNVAKDEEYKQLIIQTVEQDAALKTHVHFLGFWPDSREVLAASDVIACTSYSESLGMVVIEAMSMGRAVVSTNAGGPAETVIDSKTGFLVPPGDAMAFAEITLKLLDDPALCERIGKQAREHVIKNLSVRTYADQIERIMQKMIAAPNQQKTRR